MIMDSHQKEMENLDLRFSEMFIFALLQITFVVLQLTGVVAWNWAIVLLPVIAFATIAGTGALIDYFADNFISKIVLTVLALTQVVFAVLKLTNVITWNWALVLIPAIICGVLAVATVIIELADL